MDFPIKRYTQEELDKAIADLEKRGFKCVKRWVEHKGCKKFSQAKDGFNYKGNEDNFYHYAVMKKEEGA